MGKVPRRQGGCGNLRLARFVSSVLGHALLHRWRALVLWLGYLPLGAVVIPALAILPAWLSYGPESGILTLALAIIMFSRHYHGLLRIRQGQSPDFSNAAIQNEQLYHSIFSPA